MQGTTLKQQLRTLLRFYRFAVPHWKLIAVAVLAMLVCAATMGAAVLMLKPVTEGVFGGAAKAQTVGSPAEGTAGAGADVLAPVQASKGLKAWFKGLRVVRAVHNYIGPGPEQLKHIAYILLLLIAPLWCIAAFLETYCARRFVYDAMADLRVAIFEKLSRMPLTFFSSRRIGDLISRLTNDVTTTQHALRLLFEDMLLNPLKVVVLMLVAFATCWRLSLVVLCVGPLIVWVLRHYGGRVQTYGRKTLEKLGDITDAINQMLGGIRVVKAFGMEYEENAEFRERNRLQLRQAHKLVRNHAWADALPQFGLALCIGAVLLVGDFLLERNLVDAGSLAVFAGAVALMGGPLKRLVKVYTSVRADLAAMDRIFEVADAKPEEPDPPDARELVGVREGIRFKGVSFAYQNEQYVLQDISLSVPAGTVCAIVGETGAGKSTMLDLIPRFYEPQRGSVEIDGADVREFKRESLLRNIAIVSQHPFLFNRSIAENIRYGRREATEEQVIAAAKAAHIHDFVASLPGGYNTLAGERGARLSGGQRQCVTVARALLKDAPILILDEATSSLDNESERLVQGALGNLLKGRTAFVIAHRLSTVRFADMIVVLKAGRIIEQGTHDELLQRDGEYAKLYRFQFARPEDVAGGGSTQAATEGQER